MPRLHIVQGTDPKVRGKTHSPDTTRVELRWDLEDRLVLYEAESGQPIDLTLPVAFDLPSEAIAAID